MSMTRVTSAIPIALRDDDPAKIRSSARRVRSVLPCSPRDQRNASARLLLPLPLGPTTALMPGPNSMTVRSANDLNPTRRSAVKRAGFAGLPSLRSGPPASAAREAVGSRLSPGSDSRLLKRSCSVPEQQRQWRAGVTHRGLPLSRRRACCGPHLGPGQSRRSQLRRCSGARVAAPLR